MSEPAASALVVAAHPDDEVLGCGGTIARLAQAGDTVHVAILGEGITSRHASRAEADASELAELRETSRRAADRLGVAELYHYDLPDNRFDSVALLDVVKIVEELIERIRPRTVFTHHPGDVNVDHEVLHRAVLAATRPMEGTPVREVLAFEVPSSTEWAFGQLATFRPCVFYDVTATLDAKLEAMQLYEGESRVSPHPRSPESLEALARQRGTAVGVQAAEAFELVRTIR
jgi:LmbE family N-acetylglucosaminyl deacetylase